MRNMLFAAAALLVVGAGAGCVDVDTPREINIGNRPAPADVDSSRVPPTQTHEEARAELVKAYDHIRYLEHENERLREKYEDAKSDKEEYKRKYKRLKDRYED